MNKLLDFLSSVPLIIISGLLLLVGFICEKCNINTYISLYWISIIICGLNPIYFAINKLIFGKGIRKISGALLITIAMISTIIIGNIFACGEIAFIMALGELLEDLTIAKAQKGIKELIDLSPKKAKVIKENKIIEEDIKNLKIDDIVQVLPGEAFPIDGVIVKGYTSVNEGVLTGESIPINKVKGDSVFAGTINQYGSVNVKVTKNPKDTSLQQLINIIKEAENNKAPREKILDKWASILVPCSILLSIIAYFITRDISVSVTLLVVFCPCALVLATPTAIVAAIGQASKNGVIIKSGESLEEMSKIKNIVFDKTGTLTKGELSVIDIIPLNDSTKEDVLYLATACEENSEHPIGKAIVEYGNLDYIKTDNFILSPGKGVQITLNKDTVLCGNTKYIFENNISISKEIEDKINEFSLQGAISILVCKNSILIGLVVLSDTIKSNAKETISQLKNYNINPIILTGDTQANGEYIGREIGINEVYGNLLPIDKVHSIEKLREEKVCMVGDGVNDAPALKVANVGISMGSGSNISLDASDITLMTNDLSYIPYLIKLSKATMSTITFGISLSICINLTAIVLSFMKVLNPTSGALVHNAGSCLVILIAGLLYDRKFIDKKSEFFKNNKKQKPKRRRCCCS